MITVFSCTNRPNSNSEIIAHISAQEAEKQGAKAQVYNLRDLPSDFISEGEYGNPPDSFKEVLNTFISPIDSFLFVIPEYNGSYPGILKLFLDTIDPKTWSGKRAALIGIASGRAGNLRGMDHLTAVLNYLKIEVYSQKPSLSSIHKFISPEGTLDNEEYSKLIGLQIKQLIN